MQSRKIVKTAALITLSAFLFQQMSCAQDASPAPQRSLSAETLPVHFRLPGSVALLGDSYRAPQKGKTVYLFQDAHTNESGQVNLAHALETVLESENIRTVFTEAGSEDDSLTFLKAYGTPESRRQTGLSFLRKNRIKGTEYLSFAGRVDFTLWGVEDSSLYAKSLDAYRSVYEERAERDAYLSRMEGAIESLKPRVYGADLLALDGQRRAHLDGQTGLAEYAGILTGAAKKSGIDLKSYPNLKALSRVRRLESDLDFEQASVEQKRAARLLPEPDRESFIRALEETGSKISENNFNEKIAIYALFREKSKSLGDYPELRKYLRYLEAAGRLDYRRMIDEQSALESEVYSSLVRSPEEEKLRRTGEFTRLLRGLFSLTLQPEEFDALNKSFRGYSIADAAGFLNQKIMAFRKDYERAVFLQEGFEDARLRAAGFYELTRARDAVFVERVIRRMNETGEEKAALVTGGYHTAHLREMLKKHGVSYAVITPQIYHSTDQKKYEKILLSQNLPAQDAPVRVAQSGSWEASRRTLMPMDVLDTVQGRETVSELISILKPAGSPVVAISGARTAAVAAPEGRFREGLIDAISLPAKRPSESKTLLLVGFGHVVGRYYMSHLVELLKKYNYRLVVSSLDDLERFKETAGRYNRMLRERGIVGEDLPIDSVGYVPMTALPDRMADWKSRPETAAIPEPDVVIVATNANTHLRYARWAIEGGKKVAIEKPLGLPSDYAGLEELIMKHPDNFFSIDHFMNAQTLPRALELIKKNPGILGEILSFRARIVEGVHPRTGELQLVERSRHGLVDPAISGGGLLMDMGIHAGAVIAPFAELLGYDVPSMKAYPLGGMVTGGDDTRFMRYDTTSLPAEDELPSGGPYMATYGRVAGRFDGTATEFVIDGGKGIDTNEYSVTIIGTKAALKVDFGTDTTAPYLALTDPVTGRDLYRETYYIIRNPVLRALRSGISFVRRAILRVQPNHRVILLSKEDVGYRGTLQKILSWGQRDQLAPDETVSAGELRHRSSSLMSVMRLIHESETKAHVALGGQYPTHEPGKSPDAHRTAVSGSRAGRAEGRKALEALRSKTASRVNEYIRDLVRILRVVTRVQGITFSKESGSFWANQLTNKEIGRITELGIVDRAMPLVVSSRFSGVRFYFFVDEESRPSFVAVTNEGVRSDVYQFPSVMNRHAVAFKRDLSSGSLSYGHSPSFRRFEPVEAEGSGPALVDSLQAGDVSFRVAYDPANSSFELRHFGDGADSARIMMGQLSMKSLFTAGARARTRKMEPGESKSFDLNKSPVFLSLGDLHVLGVVRMQNGTQALVFEGAILRTIRPGERVVIRRTVSPLSHDVALQISDIILSDGAMRQLGAEPGAVLSVSEEPLELRMLGDNLLTVQNHSDTASETRVTGTVVGSGARNPDASRMGRMVSQAIDDGQTEAANNVITQLMATGLLMITPESDDFEGKEKAYRRITRDARWVSVRNFLRNEFRTLQTLRDVPDQAAVELQRLSQEPDMRILGGKALHLRDEAREIIYAIALSMRIGARAPSSTLTLAPGEARTFDLRKQPVVILPGDFRSVAIALTQKGDAAIIVNFIIPMSIRAGQAVEFQKMRSPVSAQPALRIGNLIIADDILQAFGAEAGSISSVSEEPIRIFMTDENLLTIKNHSDVSVSTVVVGSVVGSGARLVLDEIARTLLRQVSYELGIQGRAFSFEYLNEAPTDRAFEWTGDHARFYVGGISGDEEFVSLWWTAFKDWYYRYLDSRRPGVPKILSLIDSHHPSRGIAFQPGFPVDDADVSAMEKAVRDLAGGLNEAVYLWTDLFDDRIHAHAEYAERLRILKELRYLRSGGPEDIVFWTGTSYLLEILSSRSIREETKVTRPDAIPGIYVDTKREGAAKHRLHPVEFATHVGMVDPARRVIAKKYLEEDDRARDQYTAITSMAPAGLSPLTLANGGALGVVVGLKRKYVSRTARDASGRLIDVHELPVDAIGEVTFYSERERDVFERVARERGVEIPAWVKVRVEVPAGSRAPLPKNPVAGKHLLPRKTYLWVEGRGVVTYLAGDWKTPQSQIRVAYFDDNGQYKFFDYGPVSRSRIFYATDEDVRAEGEARRVLKASLERTPATEVERKRYYRLKEETQAVIEAFRKDSDFLGRNERTILGTAAKGGYSEKEWKAEEERIRKLVASFWLKREQRSQQRYQIENLSALERWVLAHLIGNQRILFESNLTRVLEAIRADVRMKPKLDSSGRISKQSATELLTVAKDSDFVRAAVEKRSMIPAAISKALGVVEWTLARQYPDAGIRPREKFAADPPSAGARARLDRVFAKRANRWTLKDAEFLIREIPRSHLAVERVNYYDAAPDADHRHPTKILDYRLSATHPVTGVRKKFGLEFRYDLQDFDSSRVPLEAGLDLLNLSSRGEIASRKILVPYFYASAIKADEVESFNEIGRILAVAAKEQGVQSGGSVGARTIGAGAGVDAATLALIWAKVRRMRQDGQADSSPLTTSEPVPAAGDELTLSSEVQIYTDFKALMSKEPVNSDRVEDFAKEFRYDFAYIAAVVGALAAQELLAWEDVRAFHRRLDAKAKFQGELKTALESVLPPAGARSMAKNAAELRSELAQIQETLPEEMGELIRILQNPSEVPKRTFPIFQALAGMGNLNDNLRSGITSILMFEHGFKLGAREAADLASFIIYLDRQKILMSPDLAALRRARKQVDAEPEAIQPWQKRTFDIVGGPMKLRLGKLDILIGYSDTWAVAWIGHTPIHLEANSPQPVQRVIDTDGKSSMLKIGIYHISESVLVDDYGIPKEIVESVPLLPVFVTVTPLSATVTNPNDTPVAAVADGKPIGAGARVAKLDQIFAEETAVWDVDDVSYLLRKLPKKRVKITDLRMYKVEGDETSKTADVTAYFVEILDSGGEQVIKRFGIEFRIDDSFSGPSLANPKLGMTILILDTSGLIRHRKELVPFQFVDEHHQDSGDEIDDIFNGISSALYAAAVKQGRIQPPAGARLVAGGPSTMALLSQAVSVALPIFFVQVAQAQPSEIPGRLPIIAAVESGAEQTFVVNLERTASGMLKAGIEGAENGNSELNPEEILAENRAVSNTEAKATTVPFDVRLEAKQIIESLAEEAKVRKAEVSRDIWARNYSIAYAVDVTAVFGALDEQKFEEGVAEMALRLAAFLQSNDRVNLTNWSGLSEKKQAAVRNLLNAFGRLFVDGEKGVVGQFDLTVFIGNESEKALQADGSLHLRAVAAADGGIDWATAALTAKEMAPLGRGGRVEDIDGTLAAGIRPEFVSRYGERVGEKISAGEFLNGVLGKIYSIYRRLGLPRAERIQAQISALRQALIELGKSA